RPNRPRPLLLAAARGCDAVTERSARPLGKEASILRDMSVRQSDTASVQRAPNKSCEERNVRRMVAQTRLRTTPAGTSPARGLLSVCDISVRFGGIVALDGVSFDVETGQIAGLIGPNGAGKTTLFNCLSRLYIPNQGDILFEGKSILRQRRHAIAKLGIGRTFQNVALFDRMSVLDNVKVGCHSRSGVG